MKKLFFISIIVALSTAKCLAQTYGGEIKAKDNSDAIGVVKRINDQLKVVDSLGNIRLGAIAGAVAGSEMQVDVITLPSVTIGTFPDNEPFNVAQINGVTPLMGAGNGGTGSLRVNIASDQVAIPVTQSGTWSLAANQSTNIAQINGVTPLMGNGTTGTGSLRVTIASDNTAFGVNANQSGTWNINNISGTVSLPTGAATSANQSTIITALQLIDDNMVSQGTALGSTKNALIGGSVTTSAPTYTTGNINPLSLQTDGSLRTAVTNTVPVSQSGTWTVQPGNTANTTAWLVSQNGTTSGGLTTYHLASAASTNATNIKSSAGQVYGWYIYNSNAAARKVAFHNTSGTPTAGSSVFFTLVIPPGSGANVFSPIGIPFSSGIAITTVTGLADSDNTGVAANDLIINIYYK